MTHFMTQIEVGREIFFRCNEAVISKRFTDDPEIEIRSYYLCKKDFEPFGRGVRSSRCSYVDCTIDMEGDIRVLDDMFCHRAQKDKEVTLNAESVIDLEKYPLDGDPFSVPSNLILAWKEYRKGMMSALDESILTDLKIRGSTIYQM